MIFTMMKSGLPSLRSSIQSSPELEGLQILGMSYGIYQINIAAKFPMLCLFPWFYRDAKLDIEECCQFVKNKLQMHGSKPFDFVQTAPCYDPSRSFISNLPSGEH